MPATSPWRWIALNWAIARFEYRFQRRNGIGRWEAFRVTLRETMRDLPF